MQPILIQNATIVDGTGAPARVGNVAMAGGRIVEEGEVRQDPATMVIDAAGLTCTPGFIDTHSHSDVQVLYDPALRPKIRQGITTEILGQDGVSVAPLPKQYIDSWRKHLRGLDGDSDELAWDWQNTRGYLDLIEKGKGTAANVAYLAPHGNLRMAAMGLANRPATEDEINRMCALLEEELCAGAAGLSSGLLYVPCTYGDFGELAALCRVAARHGKPFVVHQRSEADDIIASMQEIIALGRETGVRVHFSHFKVCGRRNRHLLPRMMELLEEAAGEGIGVSFDQYPYTAGSSTMLALLPPWAQAGGAAALLARLQDGKIRGMIARDMEKGIPGWDNFIGFAGAENIHVTSVQTRENRDVLGLSLQEMAQKRGSGVYDAVFDLLLEEELGVSIATGFGAEEDIVALMRRPEQNVCTDGLFGLKPHPRVYGSFARILQTYVRERKILTLEEAVYKMSGKGAQVFSLEDRGRIAIGKRADVLLFDADALEDHATYLEPDQFPTGFHSIFVNGGPVYQNGRDTDALPGMVIRQVPFF